MSDDTNAYFRGYAAGVETERRNVDARKWAIETGLRHGTRHTYQEIAKEVLAFIHATEEPVAQ